MPDSIGHPPCSSCPTRSGIHPARHGRLDRASMPLAILAFAPTHSPQPPLPPRRAEEGEPHFLVDILQRFHWVRSPPELVKQDVAEGVVVNGVRGLARHGGYPIESGMTPSWGAARSRPSETDALDALQPSPRHLAAPDSVAAYPGNSGPGAKKSNEAPPLPPSGAGEGVGGSEWGRCGRKAWMPGRAGHDRGVDTRSSRA